MDYFCPLGMKEQLGMKQTTSPSVQDCPLPSLRALAESHFYCVSDGALFSLEYKSAA